MERILPTYDIKGIPFVVDVDFNLLRHPDDLRKTFCFFDDMVDMGNHYRLYFDEETLSPWEDASDARLANAPFVDIAHMVKLDPEGVAAKFGIHVSSLPESDSGLESDEFLLQRKIAGKPATLLILGEYFFIDSYNGYLMAPGLGAQDWLNVNGMPLDPSGTSYCCLYDPESRKMYRPVKEKEMPAGIVAVEIPHLRFADSYNYKRAKENILLPDKEWLRRYPVRSNMEARVVPLEKMLQYLERLYENEKQAVTEQENMGNNQFKKPAGSLRAPPGKKNGGRQRH